MNKTCLILLPLSKQSPDAWAVTVLRFQKRFVPICSSRKPAASAGPSTIAPTAAAAPSLPSALTPPAALKNADDFLRVVGTDMVDGLSPADEGRNEVIQLQGFCL